MPELDTILIELRHTLLRCPALLLEAYWTKSEVRDRLSKDLQVTLIWQLPQIRLAVVRLNVTVYCPLKTDLTKSSKLSLASKIGLAVYVKVK